MTRTEVIQGLIDDNGYTSYLEIGCQGKVNFNKIECKIKKCVDPDVQAKASFIMTSDEYFKRFHTKYDIVFIDGLHTAEQVEWDIVNASKNLSKNGAIVLHDLNPTEEIQTLVPRQNKQWTGDCYKAFVGFRKKYPHVTSFTYPEDWGVGVIIPNGEVFEAGFLSELSFNEFMKSKEQLLGMI